MTGMRFHVVRLLSDSKLIRLCYYSHNLFEKHRTFSPFTHTVHIIQPY